MPATKERTYNETEIAEKLKDLPGWYFEDGWIRRVYKTDGWPTTLMLVNAVGYLAEAAYHHPDLTVTWGRITVKLQNHAAGGITDKDFELARKIEEVVLWRPQGGALEGTPNKWVRSGDPSRAERRNGGTAERDGAGATDSGTGAGRPAVPPVRPSAASFSSPASSPSPRSGGCWRRCSRRSRPGWRS